MGTSTNAYLFFGFDLGEDFEPPWTADEDDQETPDDWEEAYAEKKGVKKPIFPLDDWSDEDNARYEAWNAEKKKALEGVEVQMSTHCSCDYPMHYVYIRQFYASRGYPAIIDPVTLETTEEDVRKLREFCEFMGIDVGDKEPQWFLASDWC